MNPAKPQHAPERSEAPGSLLSGDEWSEVEASGDYVGEIADELSWTDVVVRGGRWSGVTIEGFNAIDVRFENCDLAGLVLQGDVNLRRVEFVGCRMTGAVVAGGTWRDVRIVDCVLDDTNFRMLTTRDVELEDCSLLAADFYAANLHKTALRRCDLRGADFSKAELAEVDLRSSRLENIVGAGGLRGATIDSLQVLSLARSLAIANGITVVDDDDA